MTDAVSTITLSTGKQINAKGSLDAFSHELPGYFAERVPPFMKVVDDDGNTHLINVNEIVSIEGS